MSFSEAGAVLIHTVVVRGLPRSLFTEVLGAFLGRAALSAEVLLSVGGQRGSVVGFEELGLDWVESGGVRLTSS